MPCSAINFLLAVTTDFPAASDSRTQSPAGCKASCQLNHDVRIAGENLIEVLASKARMREPRTRVYVDSPIEDAAQLHAFRRVFTQNAGNRIAHRAKTQNSDFHLSIHIRLTQPFSQTSKGQKRGPEDGSARAHGNDHSPSASNVGQLFLEVTELFFRHRLGTGPGRLPFEGAAYQVTRTQAHGQRQRQHDATKENAEGQVDNRGADRQDDRAPSPR